MTQEQIKDYLKKYRINSEEQLAKHIEELKRNTIPNNEIIFPLVDLLLNEKSVLLSFFRENSKERGETHTENKLFFTPPNFVGWFFNNQDQPNCEHFNTIEEAQDYFNKSDNSIGSIFKDKKLVKELKKDNIKNKFKGKNSVDKDDVITNSSRGEKETMDYLQGVKEVLPSHNLYDNSNYWKHSLENWTDRLVGVKENQTAYKETEGKLFYELDWGFITQMAERMASNKKDSKYNLWNWKKPMTPKGIEDLKQATLRHLLEVLEGRYEDDGREFGHLEAISDNMMMINYQLKVK